MSSTIDSKGEEWGFSYSSEDASTDPGGWAQIGFSRNGVFL